jgi:hypothetical protein
MGDVEVSIKIEINPTEQHRPRSGEVERVDEGHFRLVLSDQDPLDIDGLEQGLLQTNYPALRDALAQHLEAAVKKKSRKNAKG